MYSEALEVLRGAGWFDGRVVSVKRWQEELEADGFVVHDAAVVFLSEFGGLAINVRGLGITRARVPFELDPSLCIGESDRFSDWGAHRGATFAPIGEMDYGRFFLAMDEKGCLYEMDNALGKLAVGVAGLDMLIRGVAAEDVS
jgi:hypothetical protein